MRVDGLIPGRRIHLGNVGLLWDDMRGAYVGLWYVLCTLCVFGASPEVIPQDPLVLARDLCGH